MKLTEIRSVYLKYFEKNGHSIIRSSSLLPENDPTTLFTGSGMQSMIPYLLGEKHPQGIRICDSQKCFRTQDMDEVGDNRHTTFFEMLGNWSLGDSSTTLGAGYFKNEQIPWMFEFLTKDLRLDPKRLFVTVFRGNNEIPRDDESAQLWKKEFDSVGVDCLIVDFAERDKMQNGRIFYYDETKNWWSRSGSPEKMPVGEIGGADTEMFFEFTQIEHDLKFGKYCHPNCDCGRFVEIGNNVFMEYIKTENGFETLKQKNVDFGGGLERICAAVNDVSDIFQIDVFDKARIELEKLSGQNYGTAHATNAFRVILDHLRAATFLIGDGIIPSNKDQGYFVRRLIRRAVFFAHRLNIAENVCSKIGEIFIDEYSDVYTNLLSGRKTILDELDKEEIKFQQTLKQGMKKFLETVDKSSKKIISGSDAFDLLQSFGFPIELTVEFANEKGLMVDMDTFKTEKEKHQTLSRSGSEQKFKGGLADSSDQTIKYHTATHLLLATMREILSPDVCQKGCNITSERLRFDFNYPEKLSDEKISEIEDSVNKKIKEDIEVEMLEMNKDEAIKIAKTSFDPSKYQDVVKIYKIGDFSIEICGGPHVEHTNQLGKFRIIKEEGVSAGVRRVKAILESNELK